MYQFFFDYYPMGKTSVESRFNIPGKIGWACMEAPGFVALLYIMCTLPGEIERGSRSGSESGSGSGSGVAAGLPWENWGMAALFVSAVVAIVVVASP